MKNNLGKAAGQRKLMEKFEPSPPPAAPPLVGTIKAIVGWREIGFVTVAGEDVWFHKHLVGVEDADGNRRPCPDGTFWDDLREGMNVRIEMVRPSAHGPRCRIVGRANDD